MSKRYNIDDYAESPKNVRDIVLKIIKIEHEVDNHPRRIFQITKEDGEVEDMDMKQPLNALRKKLIMWDLDDKHLSEVDKRWGEFRRVVARKSSLVRDLNKLTNATTIGGPKKSRSIIDSYRTEILELFGEGRTIDNVIQYFKSKHVNIHIQQLKLFRQKHQNKIKELWTQHLLNDKEFNVATDRGRLQALSDMEYYYKQKFEKERDKRDVKESTVKTRQSILEQIRKEVKGDVIQHHHSGKINIEATLNANKILMENMKRVPINMMIIAMTAAKRGVNPMILMSSLANSYYAKYNGFNGLPPESLDDDLIYPSQIVKTYDLAQMVDNNDKDQSEGKFADAIAIEEDRKQLIERKTKSLKEILEERKKSAGIKK